MPTYVQATRLRKGNLIKLGNELYRLLELHHLTPGNKRAHIQVPPTVDLAVKETVPGIKGATASAQIKPATLETGLVVNVPSFINEGDKIRVNTETGEYQSRV